MVKAYFDTNVIIAGFAESHIHHDRAFETLVGLYDGNISGVVLAHGLSEMYSVLTRTPFRPRVSPNEAWQILSGEVMSGFEIVHLETDQHVATIRKCAEQGLTGGRVFDALHLQAARKAQCERIYTFDVRHFRELAPDLAGIIVTP